MVKNIPVVSCNFIWCDLSTFDLAKACAFYEQVFGWTKHGPSGNGRDDEYTLFYAGSRSAAGVYTMPTFFQDIKMPSFWMSYVRVESLEATTQLAVSLGAKCEIEPTAFDTNSRFALIRDPSGAGFTLYEGEDLDGRDNGGKPGRMIWNELHIPSLDVAEGFYLSLFDWDITPDPSIEYRHVVKSRSGEPIASILELSEEIKGPKNYWAVIFAVADLNSTLQAIAANGGSVLVQPSSGFGFAMAADDQGAMFCVSEGARI